MKYILSSSESYEFEVAREIEIIKSVFLNEKEAWVVKIIPYIVGQKYGLIGEDINYLLLSPKHADIELSNIKEFPCFVYITRLLDNSIPQRDIIFSNELEIIAWGEINPEF